MNKKDKLNNCYFYCLALLMIIATGSHQASASISAEYLFDESTGDQVYDTSGNGNHGIITGATYVEELYFLYGGNYALYFDNNPNFGALATNYVTIPDSESLRPVDSLIIEVWVKAYPHTDQGRMIVSKRRTTGDNRLCSYVLFYENAGVKAGNIAFKITTNQPAAKTAFTPMPPAGEWYHIKGEWDGSEMRLYLNSDLKIAHSISGSILYGDNPGDYPVMIGALDDERGDGLPRSGWYGVMDQVVIGILPKVTITEPASGLVASVNEEILFEGRIFGLDEGDTHTAEWSLSGDHLTEDIVFPGSVDGLIISDILAFAEAGIYSIKLTVTDASGEKAVATTVNGLEDMPAYIVVYDPEGGFVTGGGWIWSPKGPYPYMSVEGKANFGFASKYKKGADVPSGNTEFQFKAGNLDFHSSSYDWLVVTGSDYARFKGAGTINGSGEYKFMLWAGDDDVDKFRIRIWEEDDYGNESVLYDNGFDQPIGGGSIVVHTK
jgi:hypothetical protein